MESLDTRLERISAEHVDPDRLPDQRYRLHRFPSQGVHVRHGRAVEGTLAGVVRQRRSRHQYLHGKRNEVGIKRPEAGTQNLIITGRTDGRTRRGGTGQSAPFNSYNPRLHREQYAQPTLGLPQLGLHPRCGAKARAGGRGDERIVFTCYSVNAKKRVRDKANHWFHPPFSSMCVRRDPYQLASTRKVGSFNAFGRTFSPGKILHRRRNIARDGGWLLWRRPCLTIICRALRYVTVRHATLRYVKLHYVTLHYVAFPYIALPYLI